MQFGSKELHQRSMPRRCPTKRRRNKRDGKDDAKDSKGGGKGKGVAEKDDTEGPGQHTTVAALLCTGHLPKGETESKLKLTSHSYERMYGWDLTHLAAASNVGKEGMDMLRDAGLVSAPCSTPSLQGLSDLHFAAAFGAADAARAILSHTFPAIRPDERGCTALMYAVAPEALRSFQMARLKRGKQMDALKKAVADVHGRVRTMGGGSASVYARYVRACLLVGENGFPPFLPSSSLDRRDAPSCLDTVRVLLYPEGEDGIEGSVQASFTKALLRKQDMGDGWTALHHAVNSPLPGSVALVEVRRCCCSSISVCVWCFAAHQRLNTACGVWRVVCS